MVDKYARLELLANDLRIAARLRMKDKVLFDTLEAIRVVLHEKPVVDATAVSSDNRTINFEEQANAMLKRLTGNASYHKST